MTAAAVGRQVASWRRRAGLTQAELARRIGTTQSVVARLEAGRSLPSLALLARFAKGTGRTRLVLDLRPPAERLARGERRRRVRKVLGGFVFNPWDRHPTPAEARSLIADGLGRERFDGAAAPRSR